MFSSFMMFSIWQGVAFPFHRFWSVWSGYRSGPITASVWIEIAFGMWPHLGTGGVFFSQFELTAIYWQAVDTQRFNLDLSWAARGVAL
ncbi:hypothetical protein GEU84_007170 [Fertoebacter nigrum]|uniref:Uncharacterized protein n=1 Tax=Fertoeibacter niger TaxID=2656921 RepID=A0A8X8GW14_9RHOB|nr:hypothetical protein [Fertoeibacter niger]NUB44157.1 hypothetical protein [Fertoeibacter niger]